MIKWGFITLYELKKKYSINLQIVLNEKSLHKMEWDLKNILNLIKKINNYGVEKKHNLTYLNQNFIDKGIIVTLWNK